LVKDTEEEEEDVDVGEDILETVDDKLGDTDSGNQDKTA
jgi:hypothetical protein